VRGAKRSTIDGVRGQTLMTERIDVRMRHATTVRGHTVLKAITWLVAATAGFGLVYAQTSKTQFESHVTTIKAEDLAPLLGPDRPAAALPPADGSSGAAVNILLIGSDDRSGENATIGGENDGKRNDTTLILHIAADRSRVEVVSIPRDTMVDLAACERSDGSTQRAYFGMFNEAFSNGAKTTNLDSDGAACTIRTVEALTGIRMDHFAVIDFAGFRDMVNAVGGVPVCIPEQYADAYSGTYLDPGPKVLTGDQAISYVRMRKGLNTNGSDLDRIDRQQGLLKNLASKMLSAEMLYRPIDVTNFIKAIADSLTVDEEFGSLDYLGGLAFSLRGLDPSTGIVMATAPVETYPADHFKVQLNGKAPAVWQALLDDQPIAPLLDAQSASPANTATDSEPIGDGSIDPNGQDGILAACSP